ncbi:AAA family ATPase [Mesoflavibacter zeaxanthinifaciens]|uniref:AAA family ATPase n=1 Tax=Mesoflavibacter zeaxanthinifaciens TaxID=393060 RepID=UPI003A8FE9B3
MRKLNMVRQDIETYENDLKRKESMQGCLVVKEVNNWIEDAKNRPIPNMLFNEFWYEGELAILFADTNTGKSILAVQIADSLSRGKSISGFKLEGNPKKTLYLDFELSDKQFENRCSNNYRDHYKFHDNFLRAEIDSNLELPKKFKTVEDYLCKSIEISVKENEVSVLIVDNLTFISADSEKAKYALGIMKTLKQLKATYGISILVLAHTPKRDDSKPITKNDLAGSKMLMNFCDSSFAIGASSKDSSFRYIKQIKQRNTEHLYHTDNVVLCQLRKQLNFLSFQFLEYTTELEHLKTSGFVSIEERDSKMIQLLEQGLSNVKIGQELGISEATVRQRKRKLNL